MNNAVTDEKHARFLAYFDRAVAQVCGSVGWHDISKDALSTLSLLMLNIIINIGKQSVQLCNHSCRTMPSLYDLQAALVECGINPSKIKEVKPLMKLPNPVTLPTDKPPTLVKISSPLAQPSYIPEYLNLSFPQPHTYIRTPVYNLPVTSYTKLREARAKQRNDVLTSLSKQMIMVGPSTPLIPGRDDCIWVNPDIIPRQQLLVVHTDDLKAKKRKKKINYNNPYLQPPKCSWLGLFT